MKESQKQTVSLLMKVALLFKIALVLAPILVLLVVAFVIYSHQQVEQRAQGRLYSDVAKTPEKQTAVVLGCAKVMANGRDNTFFHRRIDAAANLYHGGKCQYLIVSGDNSTKNYDEPTDMQQALIEKGVPENRIYRDFAGFRTLDSMVRAGQIFGQNDIIVVSQPFHNKRAIFLAAENEIQAIGFNSRDVSTYGGKLTLAREYLARAKMMLDLHLLKTEPKYLGPQIELGIDPPPEPT